MTSRRWMFIHVSHCTMCPLYVSPFFSSTSWQEGSNRQGKVGSGDVGGGGRRQQQRAAGASRALPTTTRTHSRRFRKRPSPAGARPAQVMVPGSLTTGWAVLDRSSTSGSI